MVRAASQHRMLLKRLQTIKFRIQLALLYINKIRTLERIMLCEFQMDCDNRPMFSVVAGSCQMGQAGQACLPKELLNPRTMSSLGAARSSPVGWSLLFLGPCSQGAGLVSSLQRPASAHPKRCHFVTL